MIRFRIKIDGRRYYFGTFANSFDAFDDAINRGARSVAITRA